MMPIINAQCPELYDLLSPAQIAATESPNSATETFSFPMTMYEDHLSLPGSMVEVHWKDFHKVRQNRFGLVFITTDQNQVCE